MAAATAATVSIAAMSCCSSFASSRGSLHGAAVAMPMKALVNKAACVVSCSAGEVEQTEQVATVTRRLALGLIAGAAAVSSRVNPANAAYGEAANVFGSLKPQTGFTTYSGEGFTVDLPAKWNPSREVEFPGQVLRFEDNFDATNNLSVSILKAEKSSIKDYGTPEDLLKSVSYLLGKQSYSGKTSSEGGFVGDQVSTAAVLESGEKNVNGKVYYTISVLTRTADGDEGGKHQLIVATIDNGKLYLMKAQAGDKRWFKGAKKFVEGSINSFNVV